MRNNGIISVHQPNYLPWLGFFYKIFKSDIFVFLDDAQFSNKGMHNYTYIKTANGPYRLKYPVQYNFGDRINEVKSKDELEWKKKHLKIIDLNYRKAKFFKEIYKDYENLILEKYNNIAHLNSTIIKFYSEKLNIKTKYVSASELRVDLVKEDKIIEICKILKANTYYSGTGAKSYQNNDNFQAYGIELKYSDFKIFEYPQLWNSFQSNISALDFFMNCGYDWEMVLKHQKDINSN